MVSFVLFVRAHEAAPNLAPHWTGRLPILFWNSVGGGAGAAAERLVDQPVFATVEVGSCLVRFIRLAGIAIAFACRGRLLKTATSSSAL